MNKTIFYVPLEPYKERYTVQLSAPKTGWLERNWIKQGINYVRVDGNMNALNEQGIQTGAVLDATKRGVWSCSQIQRLLTLIQNKEIQSGDCIYFDDFWTPGIEAIPYACHLMGIRPRLFSMLHAQSIDPFDFTYPMRHWMRDFEKGIGKIMSGIFVTSTCLYDMVIHSGIGTVDNTFLCGLPYNSEEVKEHFPKYPPIRNKDQVVYSSRWDKEKDPKFFLRVVEYCAMRDFPLKFVITTSAKKLRSNDQGCLDALYKTLKKFPNHLELRENQSKEQYYNTLLESGIQFNCANQDFVSWTLLEATTCGCYPIYPYFLSFPEVLKDNKYMYVKGSVEDAVRRIVNASTWDYEQRQKLKEIYKPFDASWRRMLEVMVMGRISLGNELFD